MKELLNKFDPRKFTKDKWCTIVQVAYHLIFAGGMVTGGQHYLAEFQKTRDTIVQQVDRVEQISTQAQESLKTQISEAKQQTDKVVGQVSAAGSKVEKIGQDLDATVQNLKNSFKQLEKVCKKSSIF